ncbi:putative RNA-directed DNA polymerase, eukaryota, reverse transcriptase zinc-binding domain protein [Tanacetum coccineum]
MRQMGFSETWINWISGCLNSAYISVIVNGSPTKEFRFQKGLCQGDPLSPFLFIIAVEALHVTLQQAKSRNIFEGIKVGSTGVDVSHFQFVDDALIIGKWSHENAKNLYRILRCFELSSGLKVNFSKSMFFGLGASMTESNNLASSFGCQPSSLPCSYLGLLIGANMNKSCNWKPIIDKFHKRLTSWKAKTLSYGGRLTLSKSVLGSLGIYFFSLFKAPKKVILYLEKLRRNFFWEVSLDSKKMAWIGWKKVCSSDSRGGLGIGSLQASNLAMLSKWTAAFPIDVSCLLVPYVPDTWDYVLHNSRIFSVSPMRKLIDATLSPAIDNVARIRWNMLLPIKVNIHSWRLGLDRLLTRCNLNARGIDIDSTRCPVCNEGQEISCHLFIECPVAVGLWNMISAWWSCGDFPKDIRSLLVWGDSVNFGNTLKSCFDVVVQTTTWIIWRYRNRICFDLKPPRKDTLSEEIKVLSHCWILHRNRKLNPLWLYWVFDPIKACKNSS